MPPKVSIIIVNYNTKEVLLECLENLRNAYENLEVIVVDNASTDGSSQAVKDQHPEVTLFENSENLGLAKAENSGWKASSGEYLLYLGSDAFPETGSISKLVDYFSANQDVGMATAKLVLKDGTLDMDAHRGFPTAWSACTHFLFLDRIFKKSKLFNQYFLGYKDFTQPHEIDACISHFMFMRRTVLEELGGWDEDFFLYGEDLDMCFRIKKAGHKIMYLPFVQAVHYKGASVGVRKTSEGVSTASKETKLRSIENSTEAMKIYYKKHYFHKYPKPLTLLIVTTISTIALLRTLRLKFK